MQQDRLYRPIHLDVVLPTQLHTEFVGTLLTQIAKRDPRQITLDIMISTSHGPEGELGYSRVVGKTDWKTETSQNGRCISFVTFESNPDIVHICDVNGSVPVDLRNTPLDEAYGVVDQAWDNAGTFRYTDEKGVEINCQFPHIR